MTTAKKDYWLGSFQQSEDLNEVVDQILNLDHELLQRFRNQGSPLNGSELDNLLADTFQPSYTYTIPFESNGRKLAHLLASIINQFANLYNYESYCDALSVVIVDNELEKSLLTSPLAKVIANLNGKKSLYRFVNKAEDLNFCANGLALITLDELPLLVEKVNLLANNRESQLARLANFLHKVIEERGSKNCEIARLPEVVQRDLVQIMEDAEVKIDKDAHKNLYALNAYVLTQKTFYENCTNNYSYSLKVLPANQSSAFVEAFENKDKADKKAKGETSATNSAANKEGGANSSANASASAVASASPSSSAPASASPESAGTEDGKGKHNANGEEADSNEQASNNAPKAEASGEEIKAEFLKKVTFKTFPLGLVYVYNGHLYNESSYFESRRYLLDFFKAFLPFTMVWAEEAHQENYCALETLRVLPLKNIITFGASEEKDNPYFFYTGKVSGFNRINLESFRELQDYRRFQAANGLVINANGLSLRLSPGNNFKKLNNVDTQLIIALTLSLQSKKSVLYVVNNKEEVQKELDAIVAESLNLKACRDLMAIVEAQELPFYPYATQMVVIAKDVTLTRNMLAHLSALTYFENGSKNKFSTFPMVILGSGENNVKAKKGANDEKEIDLSEQQKATVVDFLRDRRFTSRNLERFENSSIPTCISDQSQQSEYYFYHQEQRNWNAQLSGDKFLTVRNNNFEVSYYPNLNSNPMVLAGFNNHYFDNHLVIDEQFDNKNNGLPAFYRNLNLNSGDLITNISLAIHRIINLFSTRNVKVASSQNLTAVWVLNDGQEALLPVYHKLFSNIFNKEEACNVKVSTIAQLKEEKQEKLDLCEEAINIFGTDSYAEATHILETNPTAIQFPLNEEGEKDVDRVGEIMDFLDNKDHYQLDHSILDYNADQYSKAKINYLSCMIVIKRFANLYNSCLCNQEEEIAKPLDLEQPVDDIAQQILDFTQDQENPIYQKFRDLLNNDSLTQGTLEEIEQIATYLISQKDKGLSTIILTTLSEYNKSEIARYSPDIVVLESTYDLYQNATAADFANSFVRLMVPNYPTNLVVVSSPESNAELLLKAAEDYQSFFFEEEKFATHGYRPALTNLSLDLSTAERFAYVVDFTAEDFNGPAYADFSMAQEQAKEKSLAFLQKTANQLPLVNLRAYTLPLSAYALPRHYNIDYRVFEVEQLTAEKVNGYIPALGEKTLDVQVNYFPFTTSKVINAALAILLQSKNTKARGLVVVNRPAVKQFFLDLAQDFNFVVHDFESIKLERAVFSHSVIIAEPDDFVEQAIIQHTALLTRGFKSTGNIFFLTTKGANEELFALLAQNSPYQGYYGRCSATLQLGPTKLSSVGQRRDLISPYFTLSFNGNMPLAEAIELPSFKARKVTQAHPETNTPSLLNQLFNQNPAFRMNLNDNSNIGKRKKKKGKK